MCDILKDGDSNMDLNVEAMDFKVEADPALLELVYAVRIVEERHPINNNDDDFNK